MGIFEGIFSPAKGIRAVYCSKCTCRVGKYSVWASAVLMHLPVYEGTVERIIRRDSRAGGRGSTWVGFPGQRSVGICYVCLVGMVLWCELRFTSLHFT